MLQRPLLRLLLLLLTLFAGDVHSSSSSSSVTVPLYMEHNPPKLHVMLTFGNRAHQYEALVDFGASDIWLDSTVLRETQTYDSVNGYEYLIMEQSSVYVPVRHATSPELLGRMARYSVNCILGLGLRSPIWRHWQCADFTASHFFFARGSACQPCAPKAPRFKCDARHSWQMQRYAPAPTSTPYTFPLCTIRDVDIRMSPAHHPPVYAGGGGGGGGGDADKGYNETLVLFSGGDMYSYLPSALYNEVHLYAGAASKGIHSNTYSREMPTLCFVHDDASLCLPPHTYVNDNYARRSLRIHGVNATAAATTCSVSAYSALQRYTFHYDAARGHMCAYHAPVTIATPMLYALLIVLWVVLLLVWYSLDVHHIGVVSECYARVTNSRIMFIEITVFTTVLTFLIHFVATSSVWHLPLPDGTWLLPIYTALTFAFNAAQALDFAYGFVQNSSLWIARCILVEMQLLLALWLALVHTVHGTWFSFGSVFIFLVFFFHWTQRFAVLYLAQRRPLLDRLPPRSRYQRGVAARTLCVLYSLWSLHTYLFLRHLLVPLMKTLGVVGDAPAYLTSALLIVFLIYVATRKARRDLCAYAEEIEHKREMAGAILATCASARLCHA
jgi:hypothetical protein